MIENANTLACLLGIAIASYVLWRRRHTWRMMPHDHALTTAVVLQALGFALCVPIQAHYLGRMLFPLTGIAHLRDWVGHCCFFSSIGCIIYAAVCRLLPDDEVRRWLRRIEIPGALAATAMLCCLVASSRTNEWGHIDFFLAPCDYWLDAYWIVLGVYCVYLKAMAIRALAILRQDPRSREVADIFIAAACLGIAVVFCVALSTIFSRHGFGQAAWMLLAASGTLCAVGAKESWGRRTEWLRTKPATEAACRREPQD